jgi:hypothetical protein
LLTWDGQSRLRGEGVSTAVTLHPSPIAVLGRGRGLDDSSCRRVGHHACRSEAGHVHQGATVEVRAQRCLMGNGGGWLSDSRVCVSDTVPARRPVAVFAGCDWFLARLSPLAMAGFQIRVRVEAAAEVDSWSIGQVVSRRSRCRSHHTHDMRLRCLRPHYRADHADADTTTLPRNRR